MQIQPPVHQLDIERESVCKFNRSKPSVAKVQFTLRRAYDMNHNVKAGLRVAESQSAMVVSNSAEVASVIGGHLSYRRAPTATQTTRE
jgi:hypothetical protein